MVLARVQGQPSRPALAGVRFRAHPAAVRAAGLLGLVRMLALPLSLVCWCLSWERVCSQRAECFTCRKYHTVRPQASRGITSYVPAH